jgi:hypothetical protein
VIDDLNTFAVDVRQDVLLRADIDEEESLQPEAFTQIMLDSLEESGEIEEGRACYHRGRGIEIGGYGVQDEEGIANLFTTIYRGDVPPATIGKGDIETAFRRLRAFWDRTATDYYRTLEESSEAFDMAMRLYEARDAITQLRLFLLTDGQARTEYRETEEVDGLEISFHIWDIRRLHRLVISGQRREPIEINLSERFGEPIPCLVAPAGNGEYQAYFAIIPGDVLNEIYAQYGPRLLELNVRSFLQARGKVNQAIRRTILEQPERFLAYNNGISITASEIEVVKIAGGGFGLQRIKNLQIVNGGQTTASLHHAVRRDRADLSAIRVPAKLTVVPEEHLEEIVPLISRYANSQNRISEADFSANDPFHVRVEELSRTIWAPATGGTPRQTRWFYERARGQYADGLGRARTPARQRMFKQEHPPAQKFTKTDLAKFENTWDQLPHIVSRGAQKNFAEFTIRLAARRRGEPDAEYFRQLIAKAVLFRRTERLVSSQNFGGYRANIVTYSLAYLAHATEHRIDLERIWAEQSLSDAVEDAIVGISHHVFRELISPPGGANITEWAKREACWERVRKLIAELPSPLESELISLDHRRRNKPVSGIEAPDASEQKLIDEIARIPAEKWLALSHWAKETDNLQSWQRSIAYTLGQRAKQGREPTRKQAVQAQVILEEAERLGFSFDESPPASG